MKDNRVIDELLRLHLSEALEGAIDVTSSQMHSAFLSALHNAIVDASSHLRVVHTENPTGWRQKLSLNSLLFQAAIGAALLRMMLVRRGFMI